MKKIILSILILITVFCQAQDSLTVSKNKFTYKKLILPTSLIATGIILKEPSIQKSIHTETQKIFGTDFNFQADNYFQFVPVGQMLLGNTFGFESHNGYKQMITNGIVSNVIVTAVVQGGKNAFHDLRPDGSAHNSFPSGHTTTAFNNATLLFLEYKDSNIWYASSGYLFATATGILRMANNRHWAGDVVTGAGLGIGIATAVYYWNPFNFPKKQSKSTSFLGYPILNQNTYGLGMIYQMK